MPLALIESQPLDDLFGAMLYTKHYVVDTEFRTDRYRDIDQTAFSQLIGCGGYDVCTSDIVRQRVSINKLKSFHRTFDELQRLMDLNKAQQLVIEEICLCYNLWKGPYDDGLLDIWFVFKIVSKE